MTDLDMRLSDNFTLREFVRSQIASRLGIDNTPGELEIKNLILLCDNVLQPIRDVWGAVRINSGYRCLDLNRELGSKDTSDHLKGCAADIEIPGQSNYKIAKWIESEIDDFDQLILECYTPGDPNSGWIHISFEINKNKNEVLTYDGSKYVTGLIK